MTMKTCYEERDTLHVIRGSIQDYSAQTVRITSPMRTISSGSTSGRRCDFFGKVVACRPHFRSRAGAGSRALAEMHNYRSGRHAPGIVELR
jgi:hypothetical protein